MVENKILNITSDDVLKQTDITILLDWRRILLQAAREMKDRLCVLHADLDKNHSEELKSRYIRTSDARSYNLAFVDIINQQIRQIRGTIVKKEIPTKYKAKEYIKYLKTFRTLVKESIEYIFNVYEERYPLYESVAHIKIGNEGSITDAVQEIIEALPNTEK